MRKYPILIYGISLALLLILLRYLEYSYFIRTLSVQFYVALIALIFTVCGIWAGSKLIKPKVKEVHVHVPATGFTLNESALKETGLSQREYEVLQLMATGFSNQEIADKLFVSLSTVKTHSANIFLKLDAKRRTQAVQKAKELSIIP